MKVQELYGGYMSVTLPHNADDVSLVREVPDNQEVFTHSATDQSLIVEILEYVNQPDEQALRYHFDDLCGSNDAVGSENAQVLSVEKMSADGLAMTQCQSAFLLCGQQLVSKFKETAKNTVNIYMGLFRLPQFETDILVIFNCPVNINPDSSSHGPVPVSANPWTPEEFRQCLGSLTIRNTGLFG